VNYADVRRTFLANCFRNSGFRLLPKRIGLLHVCVTKEKVIVNVIIAQNNIRTKCTNMSTGNFLLKTLRLKHASIRYGSSSGRNIKQLCIKNLDKMRNNSILMSYTLIA